MKFKQGWLISAIGVVLGTLVIVISAICAVVKYRSVFGGDLSPFSADWSNLGGFIGGIFGPLISFITLIAVMLTVLLQKRLLDEQGVQFTKMNNLQEQTFATQALQIEDAQRQLEQGRANDLLNSLHSFILLRIESDNSLLKTFKDAIMNSGHNGIISLAQGKLIAHSAECANTLSFRIEALIQLAEEMVLTEFSNTAAVRAYFDKAYSDIKQHFKLKPID